MSFIKKHKILSLLLFLMPVVVSTMLRVLDFRQSIDVNASDWITLLAGLLAYYGTVILAVVTVSQNDKLIEFQKRQERREQLQDERDERQERREERQEHREERQEERDKLQQEIARRQLEISERQKEIADRQLQHVEREQEITETILRNSYQPTFEISSLKRQNNGTEEPIELKRQMFISGYDHEFKATMDGEERQNILYISFDNKSKSDAYEVSIADLEPKFLFEKDKDRIRNITERQNEFYKKLFVTTFEHIPPGDGKVMTFALSDDEKDVVVHFTMTFRNAYQHWFYQDVVVCIGRVKN